MEINDRTEATNKKMPYCHRDSPHLLFDEHRDSNSSTVITKLAIATNIPKHPTIATVFDDDPLSFAKKPIVE